MTNQIDLKELERKAYLSTYQDGLWDLYLGVLVMCVAVFIYRPESGYSPLNIIMEVCASVLAGVLFWVGKKFLTLPRMGHVVFGPARKRKGITLAIILGAVVLVQALFILVSFGGWINPEWGERINTFLHDTNMERLAVAAIGSLFVGPSMILIAYFSDFPRGYYIAIMFTLAVFLMILLNQPIYPIILGALIVIPGLVLLVRFLKKYPLPREEASHE